jgi:hypothetical protein
VTSRILVALVMLTVLGCGSNEPVGDPAVPTVADTSTALQIDVDRGDGTTARYYLTCDPPGGDHPTPEAACEALAGAASLDPDPLAPVPPDVACTEIYGGPQTAVVEGTLDGQPVRIELSRVNGCEIDRWDAVIPLLAEPAGAGP